MALRPAARQRTRAPSSAQDTSGARRRRPLDLSEEQGTVLVRRVAYGAESERRDTLRVPVFATDPARVRVAGGLTLNLGDYNSARVDVMVELPCYPEETELRRAKDFAAQQVEVFLREEQAAVYGDTTE